MSRWNVYRCGNIVRPSVRSKSLVCTLGCCKKLGPTRLRWALHPTAPPSLPAPCHDKSVSSAPLPTHARRAQHFHSKRAYAVPSTAHARCLARTRALRRQLLRHSTTHHTHLGLFLRVVENEGTVFGVRDLEAAPICLHKLAFRRPPLVEGARVRPASLGTGEDAASMHHVLMILTIIPAHT